MQELFGINVHQQNRNSKNINKMGKRTDLTYTDFSLFVRNTDDISIYKLKPTNPNAPFGSITFINTNGIMAITGTYGNWILNREFHPYKDKNVSDMYWVEKLQIASTQKPLELDVDETREKIGRLLNDDENELDEDEIDYLEGCLNALEDGELDYTYYAYRENCGSFSDGENVPFIEKPTTWLTLIFDAWEILAEKYNKNEFTTF